MFNIKTQRKIIIAKNQETLVRLILGSKRTSIRFLIKRLLDTIAVFVISVTLSVPLLAIALLIKLDSPRAVFYRQTPLDFKGIRFEVCKFQTMVKKDSLLQRELEAQIEIAGGVLY